MRCRFCDSEVNRSFVNLGHQPPSNAYLTEAQLAEPETAYPLQAFVCENCWLVQVPTHAHADELFTSNYAYFSSVSSSWVEHARNYVEMMIPRLSLDRDSLVVEIASNDGYLLQFLVKAGIPCVGIEPTASTASAARELGIETIEEFFGQGFARQFVVERKPADLVLGNNVLAHVPDINDFVTGVASLLAEQGVATFEFPHLMRLVEGLQFDTIYHEHYSYLSFTTVCNIFEHHGLRVFDVDELPTHGGSLRIFATHEKCEAYPTTAAIDSLKARETAVGMQTPSYYENFQSRVDTCKNGFLQFLLDKSKSGSLVVGYGAAAKGNTLLNYAGVRADLIPFVCDAAASKQGKYLPGSQIPITSPDVLKHQIPDSIILLPWNLAEELISQLEPGLFGCEFLVAVPEVKVLACK